MISHMSTHGLRYFLYHDTKHKLPQIYIQLTRFENNDGRKLPLKYYYYEALLLSRNNVKQFHKKRFFSVRRKLLFYFRDSPENITLWLSKTCVLALYTQYFPPKNVYIYIFFFFTELEGNKC